MPTTTLARLVKIAAAAADPVRGAGSGLVVLLYHRVGGSSTSAVDLPLGLFTEQMEQLAATGGVVSLDDALTLLGSPTAPEGPPRVVITFDDGTGDFADAAVPVLERLRLPATLYLATDPIEAGRPFAPDATTLSWSALADTMASGLVTVGSHTHTHVLLDRLDPGLVADDLDRSIALIEDRLGATPRHFAYPKALPGSPGAAAAVRARFSSAAVAGTRPNHYGATDPYHLLRSPIQTADGMRWFRRKVEGGMALEDDLRRIVNRRRYAGASH
ncbi:MAG: polysaccharide deacetylase family protein [Actinobacteria bacterium]|nr:polysaccharide deacetylase family protein [Actinomycetota bacterium]